MPNSRRKKIDIDDIPLGMSVAGGKTVGFDVSTRKRKYITVAQARRPTFLYVPNPSGDRRRSLMGYLLTVMRNKPTMVGFDYQRLLPTMSARERAFLNKAYNRVNVRIARLGEPRSADDMFKRGGDKIAWLTSLAATYE
jgi:hypothetical protein